MRIIRPGSALLPAMLVLLSCNDPSSPRTPTSIAVVSGAGQTAAVTEQLPLPVVVEVKDIDGKAVSGVSVAWSVATGGGTVSAPMTTTNRSGRAEVQWTLGSIAGQNRLSAGVTGVAPASVTATAQTGAPASASITAGNGQIGLQSLPLGDAIVVRVRDAHDNGVPGTAVTFTPSAGVVTPHSAMTDMSGVASAIWTLGDAGEQNVVVSVAGLAGDPLHVTATALAPGAMAELLNDQVVSDVGAGQGENRYYRIAVPANVTRLTVSTTGGTGDVDLFVRPGRLPTTAAYTCRSITPTATESCTVELPAAGDWYVLLDAYSAYSGVTLRATYVVGGNMVIDVTGLPDGIGGHVVVAGPEHYEKQLTSTSTLPALAPGRYTITASFIRHDDAVYASTPDVQSIDIAVGATSNVTVVYAVTSGELNLDIARAYITQSVQRSDGSIPLVAGRDGLLRVLARGNAVSNAMPTVRARFYHNGSLVETRTIAAPSATLPVSHDERTLNSTWNVAVPGSLIQPGMALLIDVDPDDEITESDESDNHFPVSGTPLPVDVRSAALLQARFVPVVQSGGAPGDVTDQNRDTYVTKAQALYPLPGIDVDVRAPYNFDGTLPALYDATWQQLLGDINALRLVEAPGRYHYGVIKPTYTSGGTGIGYLGQPAALGVDWPDWRAETVAHEWGHNFNRLHVDCGGPPGIDPNYPYAGGRLGHNGYDSRTNEIRPLDTHHDLMSYCSPTWSSDYTYEAVMSFRAAETGTSMGTSGGVSGAQPSLLVWGRISSDGVVLEPSFEVVTTPAVPRSGGRYRLTGTNDRGTTILDLSFDGYEIDHLPGVRHFAYAIPLSSMGGAAPDELRLRGRGVDGVRRQASATGVTDDVRLVREGADRVRFQWNAARTPMLMVRDVRTGEILSFARGGDVQVRTSALELEITMSDGVKSTVRSVAVPR
jgi:hypothetical protein